MTEGAEDIEKRVQKYVRSLQNSSKVRKSLKRFLELDISAAVLRKHDAAHAISRYMRHADHGELAKQAFEKVNNILTGKRKSSKHEIHKTDEPRAKDVKREIKSNKEDLSGSSKKRKNSIELPTASKVPTRRDTTEEDLWSIATSGRKTNDADLSVKFDKDELYRSTLSLLKQEGTGDDSHSQQRVDELVRKYNDGRSDPQVRTPQELRYRPLSTEMFKPRKDERRMYSGRRKNTQGEVQSLISIAQNVLSQNIGAIHFVGYSPYHLLKPVLEKASIRQLDRILSLNHLLVTEADELYLPHIKREFPQYNDDGESSTYSLRDAYHRLVRQRQTSEAKRLAQLTNKIACKKRTLETGRKTQVIDEALTPRDVRRRQIKNGTVVSAAIGTPSAQQLSQARKAVAVGDKSQLAGMASAVVNRNSKLGSHGTKSKAPGAPLMKKTMKMLNMKRR